ncbi:hypothetical protein P8936_03970 [Edaphobacter paludis]|uniref:Uncharacterized protein n=1 Tax=Edaphobacter paludis TaxID=3035702 RepID=A0AAU7CZ13_9BACT
MANEMVRRGGESLAKRNESVVKKHAKKSVKHAAKKAAKHAPKKAAKHAKKSAKHLKRDKKSDAALEKAFHHLQRAAAVISLIEKDAGGDLRMLLSQGVEIYSVATDSVTKQNAKSALGLLRAAEHLAMAGLYSAREKYRPAAAPSGALEPEGFAELRSRFSKVTVVERKGYGGRVQSMGLELLKRSEGADHDPHLAWELRMAADGLCLALEAGL